MNLEKGYFAEVRNFPAGHCDKFFDDKITGSKIGRPGLYAAIEYARKGDVIVVW